MSAPDPDLVAKLLEQNAELIRAVKDLALATNPVEIIKALNPPLVPTAAPLSPWEADPEHPDPESLDDWANPDIPFDQLIGEPEWVEAPVPAGREDPGD